MVCPLELNLFILFFFQTGHIWYVICKFVIGSNQYGTITHFSADVGWCWGLWMSYCICVQIWVKAGSGSGSWTYAGLKVGQLSADIHGVHDDIDGVDLCFYFIFFHGKPYPALAKSGLRLSMSVIWNLVVLLSEVCVGFFLPFLFSLMQIVYELLWNHYEQHTRHGQLKSKIP